MGRVLYLYGRLEMVVDMSIAAIVMDIPTVFSPYLSPVLLKEGEYSTVFGIISSLCAQVQMPKNICNFVPFNFSLKPWYLEECASTLATTYSSGTPGHDKSVGTVDMDGKLRPDHICTVEHTGNFSKSPSPRWQYYFLRSIFFLLFFDKKIKKEGVGIRFGNFFL